jgi:hypothetical protein
MKLDPTVPDMKVTSHRYDPTESTFIPLKDADKCECGRWKLKTKQYCQRCTLLRAT